MRLKGQDATGHTTLLGLASEQCQHGLVAPVHAVKIADRKGARLIQARVLETTKKHH
jgi:hypothetical protein